MLSGLLVTSEVGMADSMRPAINGDPPLGTYARPKCDARNLVFTLLVEGLRGAQ